MISQIQEKAMKLFPFTALLSAQGKLEPRMNHSIINDQLLWPS